MNVYETVRLGVLSKKPCKIFVRNEPERRVCPYLVGKSSNGEDYVLYYQYGGYSASGLQDDGSSGNWRCGRVADIAHVEIVDESWHQPVQKPKTRGTCVVAVDVEIEGYY